MKKFTIISILTIAALCMAMGLVLAEEYRLAPGDVLGISIWGHEEFQGKDQPAQGIEIRPDGRFSFPLAGEVLAAGLTPQELRGILAAGISEYVLAPQVTVNVLKFHTTRIYVMGEVTKPGMYEIEKQHNLLDAIGSAGGITQDTAKKKVYVIHKDQTGHPLKINLLKLLQEGDMSQNMKLADGDVVYLTKNGRLDFSRDILPYLSGIYYVKHLND